MEAVLTPQTSTDTKTVNLVTQKNKNTTQTLRH